MLKKSKAIVILSIALFLGVSLLVYAQFGEHGGVSAASASVGTIIANTSASSNVQGVRVTWNPTVNPPTTASMPALSAVSLMVTDVDDDGAQDIKLTVTNAPLPSSDAMPGGAPTRHGVFIMNGASGLTMVNTVTSVLSE